MLQILSTPSTLQLLPAIGLPEEALEKLHQLASLHGLPDEPDPSRSGDILEICDEFQQSAAKQLGPKVATILQSLEDAIPSPTEARAATEWVRVLTQLGSDSPPNDPSLAETLAVVTPITNRYLAENHRLIEKVNAREAHISASNWGQYMRSKDFSVAAKILRIAEVLRMRAMWLELNAVLEPEGRGRLLNYVQSLRPDMAEYLQPIQ